MLRHRQRFAQNKRVLSTGALTALTLASASAGAEAPTANDARAEALFNTAKQLQASGQGADACALFAESKRLAPGVGVSLHLADCYERIGRTATAWQAFDEAEKMARSRGDDKRANMAQGRARALEPRLERLTLVASPGQHSGWQVTVDGAPLPTDHWNAALAMDPGDHTIVVSAPGQAQRTLHAHLDPASNAVTLHIDEATTAPSPAPVQIPAPTPQAPAASVEINEPPPSSLPVRSGDGSWRTLAEVGLVGVVAAGLGFGSFFMIRRAHFIEEGPPADPELTHQATTAATISFVASGVALTSAFVLFFTAPGPRNQVGWLITPTPLQGGGGAVVRATF